MPRPSRNRARPTRSPATFTFNGFLIEAYNHVDDLPVFTDAPKKRPRHATRGAAAAERRDLAIAAAAAAGDSSSPASDGVAPSSSQPSLGVKTLSARGSRTNLRSTGPPEPVPMKPASNPCNRGANTIDGNCDVCLRKGYASMILRCIECGHTVHSYCLNPPQVDEPHGGVWTCKRCTTNPAAEKHLVNRAFKDAVHKYPFLLDRKYMEAMTDSVQLATTATTAPRVKREPAELELAIRTPTDPKIRKTENTVILKLTPSDSDVEELRPGHALPERKAAARRAQSNRIQASAAGERPSKKRELDTTYMEAAPNDSHKIPQNIQKHDHPTQQNTSGTAKAAEPGSSPPATAPTGGAASSAAGNSSVSPFVSSQAEPGKATTPRSTPRAQRRPRTPRVQKEKPVVVNQYQKISLRLRVRAPIQKNKGPDLKRKSVSGVQNAAQKESTASIEMRKRLARARARKAEIRRAKKESQAEAAAAAVAAAAAAARTSTGMSDVVKSVPTEALGTTPAAKDAIGTPTRPAVGGNESGAMLKTYPVIPKAHASISVPKQKSSDTNVGPASAKLPRDRSAEVSPGVVSVPGASFDGIETGKQEEGPKEHGAGNVKGTDRVLSTGSSMAKGVDRKVVGPVIIIDDEESNAQVPAQSSHDGLRNANTLPMKSSDGPVFVKAIKQPAPTGQLQNQVDAGKGFSLAPTTQDGGLQQAVNAKRTPEQRTAAKMATLFQSSARPGDLNSKPVASNRGGFSHDAKNEALLTLAMGLKRSSERRKTQAGSDRDPSNRASRLDSKPGSAQSVERSRMQAAALAKSGRARMASSTSSPEAAGASASKNSLRRLLIDPPAGHSAEMQNSPRRQPMLSKGPALTLEKSNLFRVPIPGEDAVQRHGKLSAEKNSEAVTRHGNLKGLTSTYPQSAPITPSYADASKLSQAPPNKGQRISQDAQWSHPSRSALDLQVVSGVPSAKLPSSHSGSQSEPGSASGRGAQPLTLKRKRTSLARTVNENQSGYRSGVNTMRAPDTPVTPTLGSYRGTAEDYHASRNAFASRSGEQRPLSVGNPGEYRPLSYGREASAGFSPVRVSNQQQKVVGPEGSSNAFIESQTNIPYRRDSHGSKVTLNHLTRLQNSDELTSSPAKPGHEVATKETYGEPPAKRGGPTGQGLREDVPTSVDHGGRYSMIPDNGVGSGQGLGSAFAADFKAVPDFEDPVHSDKRLRRSQAPTLPTATRRAQYEQGRAMMAMCTPSSQQDNQATFPSSRRLRGPQRHGDQHGVVQRPGPDWTIPSNGFPASSNLTSTYAPFEQRVSQSGMLNHELISHGGARPQLVPVAREPEISQSQNERLYSHGSITHMAETSREPRASPTLQASHQSPMNRMPPEAPLQSSSPGHHLGTSYRPDSFDAPQEMNRTIHDGFKQLPPPGFAASQTMQQQQYDTFSTHQTHVPASAGNIWQDNPAAPRNPDLGSHHAPMEGIAPVRRDSIPLSQDGHMLQQQPKPTRTDPSLKNLLL